MASLTFKPWAQDAGDASSLKDILSRVHLERGHFRDITEASLQEEIAAEGALELSESDDDGDDDGEAEESPAGIKPSTREEVWKARTEMMQLAESANNQIMIALDYVSLLLSKDALQMGQSTMSPSLKASVSPGTLGIDLWDKLPQDSAREAQDELLATNIRIQGLQQSADRLLAAASRLEDNVRKETQYWNSISSITEKGWNVCKIPGQQHRLGVTFGFSESLGQFSRQGIAALNASWDGEITLERGIGSKPRAMRVLLKRGDNVVGSSKIPALLDDAETTLEARIRHARDSLFDEELYHEMIRESRSQAALGVATGGRCISFTPDTGGDQVVFELVSLDEPGAALHDEHEQDAAAQAIALAARMLLSQAHRERLKKRSDVPPPMSERKEERAMLPILRPVMAFVLHQAAIAQLNAYLERVERLLTAAKVEYDVQRAQFGFRKWDVESAEALIEILKQPWNSEASISLGESTIKIGLQTTLARAFGTVFTIAEPDKRPIQLTTTQEICQAIDGALASQLTLKLAKAAGEEWHCNRQEALISNTEDKDVAERSSWVAMDGDGGTLSLSSMTKKVIWTLQGESATSSLEQAFGEIIG